MDTSEHCKEVYAHFGLAMYRAQCVEQSIAGLITFFHFFPENLSKVTSQEEWEKSYDNFDGAISAKTMGQLVRFLADLGAVDSAIETNLRIALTKRNWLAHRFFVDHASNFVSEAGRGRMIVELQGCWELFNEIEDVLNPITYSLCENYGLTKERLEATEREMFERANGDLAPP